MPDNTHWTDGLIAAAQQLRDLCEGDQVKLAKAEKAMRAMMDDARAGVMWDNLAKNKHYYIPEGFF